MVLIYILYIYKGAVGQYTTMFLLLIKVCHEQLLESGQTIIIYYYYNTHV